jgi:DMSO reductase anchor subunit
VALPVAMPVKSILPPARAGSALDEISAAWLSEDAQIIAAASSFFMLFSGIKFMEISRQQKPFPRKNHIDL